MSYGDFYIRCEHKFLQNIYSNEQLKSSPQISTLAIYYQTYEKFLKICLALQSVLISHSDIADIEEFNFETKSFIENECSGLALDDLRKNIEKIVIKI